MKVGIPFLSTVLAAGRDEENRYDDDDEQGNAKC